MKLGHALLDDDQDVVVSFIGRSKSQREARAECLRRSVPHADGLLARDPTI